MFTGGIDIDSARNAANGPCLTSAASRVSAWMMRTDEESVIARQTLAVANGRADGARRVAKTPGSIADAWRLRFLRMPQNDARAYKEIVGRMIKMQPAAELNWRAPDFHALTDDGARELSNYLGRWLAMMYCPRGACAARAECLNGLQSQAREIGALGGQLLVLHPALAADDKSLECALRERNLKSLLAGTVLDPKVLQAYNVREEDGLGHGVTGIFLVDPQGILRAAARYSACAPLVVHEIAWLMRAAIERFGQSGTELPATAQEQRAARDGNYGCVEWFQYR